MCTLDIILSELKKQKLTQKQLAEYLGMQKNAVSEWRSGRNQAYKKYLPEIAQFLGVTVSYLVGDEQQTKKSPSIKEEDIKVALFGGDKEVSDELWDEVMKYAEYLKEKYKKN